MRISSIIAIVVIALGAAACATSPRAVSDGPSPAPSAASAASATLATGEDVVRGMYQRYAGKWYRLLTFRQQTTNYDSTGAPHLSYWFEAAMPPGRLRIDFEPSSDGGGVIYNHDSVFVFRHDSIVRAMPAINPLLLLGFDVYTQPAETTMAILRREGFDLSKMHQDTWDGRPMYVVGALAGDSTSKQFWVERDRMLFVRVLEPSPRNPSQITDYRFESYQPLGGGWVAPVVRGFANGKPTLLEEYTEISDTTPLGASYFDPRQWVQTKRK